MAKATKGRSTPPLKGNYDRKIMDHALATADKAAKEPDRLKRRDLEQEAIELWHKARKVHEAAAGQVLNEIAGLGTFS
jgi:hypothetical protein